MQQFQVLSLLIRRLTLEPRVLQEKEGGHGLWQFLRSVSSKQRGAMGTEELGKK